MSRPRGYVESPYDASFCLMTVPSLYTTGFPDIGAKVVSQFDKVIGYTTQVDAMKQNYNDEDFDQSKVNFVGLEVPAPKARLLKRFLDSTVVLPEAERSLPLEAVSPYVQDWSGRDKVGSITGPINPGSLEAGMPYTLANYMAISTEIAADIPANGRGRASVSVPVSSVFPAVGQLLGGAKSYHGIGVLRNELVHGDVSDFMIASNAGALCVAGVIGRK